MALDATVGASTSDSFATLPEAEAYFATRTPSTAWDELSTDAAKEVVLKQATRRLMQERYKGHTVKPLNGTSSESTQALPFPRYEVESREGWTYLHTVIPEGMKRAQFELAYAIADGSVQLKDTGLEGFDAVTIGPMSVDVRHQRLAGALPQAVLRELREFLVSSGVNVPLSRS